jgi:hypothetical protein
LECSLAGETINPNEGQILFAIHDGVAIFVSSPAKPDFEIQPTPAFSEKTIMPFGLWLANSGSLSGFFSM